MVRGGTKLKADWPGRDWVHDDRRAYEESAQKLVPSYPAHPLVVVAAKLALLSVFEVLVASTTFDADVGHGLRARPGAGVTPCVHHRVIAQAAGAACVFGELPAHEVARIGHYIVVGVGQHKTVVHVVLGGVCTRREGHRVNTT